MGLVDMLTSIIDSVIELSSYPTMACMNFQRSTLFTPWTNYGLVWVPMYPSQSMYVGVGWYPNTYELKWIHEHPNKAYSSLCDLNV